MEHLCETKMANETNSSGEYVEYPLIFLWCERINAFLILTENLIVAICLFTHRTRFPKKEFWLQLVSLTSHDLFTGVLILLLSYLRSTLINADTCTILWLFITINEMTFLCNILGICVYRLLFLIKSGRFRFGWTAKTTLTQVTLSLVICTIYSCIPLILGWTEKYELEECSIPQLFGDNLQKYGVYMGTGFGLLLVCTDVLYCVLLYNLHKILKRRQKYHDQTDINSAGAGAIRLLNVRDISHRNRQNRNKHLLVYGGEGRDNQKQGIYLIGAILLWINLSVGAPIGINFIASYETSVQLSKVLFQLMILIPMNNSFFNPWMYALQSRQFRIAMKENTTQLISVFTKK